MLNQSINNNTMCPNYIIKFRNTNTHLLKLCTGAWAKIATDIDTIKSVKL